LSELHKRAEERYKAQIPPGYSDLKAKAAPEAYGDYIGWHQLMEIARSEQKGIIFVIDDFKEDWWQIERERTVGPRPELLEEFAHETTQRIYMYTSENFLRAAKEYLALDIRDDVIEEVTLRLESQRKTQRSMEAKSEKPLANFEDKRSSPLKPTEAPPKSTGELPKAELEGE